jgi:multiple sugar transport system substrate-binding protein
MPHGVGGFFPNYRRSWHDEVGAKEFPKTWDEWREVGKKLRAKGRPVGQSLGHGMNSRLSPTPAVVLAGQKSTPAARGRPQLERALESVKFMQAFWKKPATRRAGRSVAPGVSCGG